MQNYCFKALYWSAHIARKHNRSIDEQERCVLEKTLEIVQPVFTFSSQSQSVVTPLLEMYARISHIDPRIVFELSHVALLPKSSEVGSTA